MLKSSQQLFCLIALFCFAGTLVPGTVRAEDGKAASTEASPDKPAKTTDEEYYELMRVFVDTFQEIDRNYVKDVDRRKLIEGAVRGMLTELDPYSDYIAPEDLDKFTQALSQEFTGVGIRVNFDEKDRAIEVVTPLAGSPAYDAGIHSGDQIVEIDGKPVKDFPHQKELTTAVEMLQGKQGEKVELGIVRAGDKDRKVERLELIRDTIHLDTVLGDSCDKTGKWELMLDPEKKIGYIRITHFTSRSAAEVREALKSLRRQGMKGLIIDLRTNPGGLLQSAVDICDLFIEEGTIVSTDGRNSLPRKWTAKSFGTFTGFPIAVLINKYSASASEIVSACLQDHGRAVVIGERSWGKGSVQDVIDLEGGKSALKLTTASYHRPSGKNIHKFPNAKDEDEWGVSPNEGYRIEYSMPEFMKYQEDRRLRDIPGKGGEKPKFDDRQLNAARKYIEEQLAKGTAAPKNEGQKADDQKKEDEAPPAPVETKKAARNFFRLYPVPAGQAT
ncbi:S41 family peptidase [Planctomicrobium sp. SH664]|uniref:S41 family peptidase n=1 Tax=Planctomicrobium sp. SH664 TaxID=3448125 RepID=UPI003F5AE58B